MAGRRGVDDLFKYSGPSIVTKACEPKYMVLECGCGRRVIESGCCCSEDCTTCSGPDPKHGRTARRRGQRIVDRIYSTVVESGKMLITNFTVPIARRERFRKNCKLWGRKVSEMIKRLKEEFGLIWGWHSSHPVGDDGVTFHPHFHLCWFRDNPSGFVDVRRLREIWSSILGVCRVVVHHQYVELSEKGKIIQRCRYNARPFPGWSAWRGMSVRWIGKYPKKKKVEKDTKCQSCGEKFVFIGSTDESEFNCWHEFGRDVTKFKIFKGAVYEGG